MQGTLTIADTSVTFIIEESDEDDNGTLFVQDGLSGMQHKREHPRAAIFAALAVMLLGEEYELPEEIVELAESVQPSVPELRFIP